MVFVRWDSGTIMQDVSLPFGEGPLQWKQGIIFDAYSGKVNRKCLPSAALGEGIHWEGKHLLKDMTSPFECS